MLKQQESEKTIFWESSNFSGIGLRRLIVKEVEITGSLDEVWLRDVSWALRSDHKSIENTSIFGHDVEAIYRWQHLPRLLSLPDA